MDKILKFSQNTFSSLSIRNYRLYFFGQAISLSGTWMQTIAQGWLVLQITNSGTQLGIVVALQFLPLLLLGPLGGLFADRHNKRRILFYTHIGFGLVTLFLSILVLSGTIQLWELYLFSLIFGIGRVFDNPARQTFVTEMVGNTHLKNAVSLDATVNSMARAIGPSISGILIVSVGIGFCFLINALSFFIAVFFVYLMRSSELFTTKPVAKRPGELAEGFRYVCETPLIRNMLIMMALVGTFVYEFQVSLPIFAQKTFLGDAASYAWLMSALGVGSVLGGLYAAGRSKIAPQQLLFFLFFSAASLLAAASMPTLELAAIALVIAGFFTVNATSLANTIIQLESVPSMRGRVMALWSMAMLGSTPIGGPIVGFFGEYGGGRWGVAIGGFAALSAAIFGWITLRQKSEASIPESVRVAANVATGEHAKPA